MSEEKAICNLDYLVGTLATAYKGLITSLVLKDFCMAERDAVTIFKGTVFSVPPGDYQATLMHEGIEISRSSLRDGYFELQADSSLIAVAGNLQIDLVQSGRHIGTFLLKRERKEGFFTSALELSEEIKGINFGFLTHPLSEKIGLLKKAEDIISAILSTKQDWRKLSEKMNSFSRDLFWFDRKAYYVWFDVLVKWSISACERTAIDARSKAVSNVLSLIELPVDSETDTEHLRLTVGAWLHRLTGSPIDLAAGLTHSRKVLSRIHEVFPEAEIGQALQILIASTIDRVKKTPAITEDDLQRIKDTVTLEDYVLLQAYSDSKRRDILESLSDVRLSTVEGYAKAFEIIDSADSWLSKDRDMVTVFFDVIERNMTKASADPLSAAFAGLFTIYDTLPPDIYRRAIVNTVGLMRKLAYLDRADVCDVLLTHIENRGDPLRTDIILSADMASAVLGADRDDLLKSYNRILEKIIIPAPGLTGFSRETWAELANPSHLEMLSKFLNILELGAKPFKQILIRVICNVFISGVFIPDDRLFQREISKYLNSGTINEDFLLHYILLKKLPVYYHEVGATGRLRDDTTEIDSWGNDPVLYFIRKQVHVNSSNHLIRVMEEVLKSWVYGDPDVLQGYVPEEILKSLSAGLLERYSSVLRPFFEAAGILDAAGFHFEKIPALPVDEIDRKLKYPAASDEIRLKILLLCRIYSGLTKKYSLVASQIESIAAGPKIIDIVNRLITLKGIITSPEKTQPQESLYFKRHIAFGIPSVMGSYHEPKFDALAEFLDLEEKLRALFDVAIADIRTMGKEFSAGDVMAWIECIGALDGLLQLHDLGNFQIDEVVVILKENNLYLSQIIDLLKICQKEMTRAVEFITETFHLSLVEILETFPRDELPEYLRGLDPEASDFISKSTDIVMRAIMGSIAGFFEHDILINTLIEALNSRMTARSDELLYLSDKAGTEKQYFEIDGLSDIEAMGLSPLIGNKAKNLVYLRNRGLLIPPGVVFLADKTPHYSEYTESAGFRLVLQNAVKKIEEKTGMVFGGKEKPLFLSVRSGSYVSMPGILSSILYCGINRETLAPFIAETANPWLAWDSYRRFIEHYGTVVYGLDSGIFDSIIDDVLREYGIANREGLDADHLRQIVHLFQQKLVEMRKEVPEDVYEQLKESVKAIYRSWYSERSLQFKKAMAISEHWGTSVTLMQMIYGNDRDSGASVFFTRKPFSLATGIFGDTREKATGAELVYGRSVNRPLTRQQEMKGQHSLEEIDPELFRMHEDLARDIEQAMRGLPQEVEATYTKKPDGDRSIYVLQTRNMEFYRGFTRRFDDICRMESKVSGRGVGVYGGALSGVASFSSSPATVKELRKDKNLPVILLKKEASTDDVSLMPEINGIVTAAGGATSHAAVLAQKFRLTAIVGCSDMKIERDQNKEFLARIGMLTVREGDHISIDGSTGLVYSGLCFSATEV